MEKEGEEQVRDEGGQGDHVSPMKPVTQGGGLYGTVKGQPEKPVKPPASNTQNADEPERPDPEPKHKPPPSSGDRDIDITGQSYIQ
ncbi:hypothetical protein RJ640_020740 [Escallonia rubra]|uniref:Uncharacterized protein n=1 Tax=Escallonia rubra TaxID=112253 RepID=A0AA88UR71_9ASTE|nr:hypothetical protein RJ640_020740 [Escallonia rubra]